jgi:superfamily II DNA or RNA helicase
MSKAIIKVENNYSWLQCNNRDAVREIWKSLRWKRKGFHRMRAYQQRKWDGCDEFFKLESGRFMTGLLPEIQAALAHFGVSYALDDRRKPFKFGIKEINDHFLENCRNPEFYPKEFLLRDYQVDFTNQLLELQRGVIQSPTASGKSAIMICLLKALPPNIPTIITSKSVSLVSQIYEDMQKWGIEGAGKVFGSKKKDFQPNMKTAVNIDSIHKLEGVFPKIKALIVDEGHLMMSKKPESVYRKLKNATFRVSVSATPFKFGGTDKSQKYKLKGHFGPMLKTDTVEGGILTTEILQQRGYLSGSDCHFYPVMEPDLPYDIYQDAVTRGIAENYHFHDIVKRLVMNKEKCPGRTLIMVDRIAHGDILSKMIPGALWVQGKDDLETRKQVIQQLQTSKGDVVAIAMQQIFNAGINFFLHNLVNAAGGQAEHQIIQRMGRGLRTVGDKTHLNYYDFVFTINDYLYKHSRKRIKILNKEKHKITIHEELDF